MKKEIIAEKYVFDKAKDLGKAMRRRLFDHPDVWRPLNEGEMLTLRTIRYALCIGVEKVRRDLGETFGYFRGYSCISGNINALVACKLVDETRLTKQSNNWILQYSITELGARVVNEAAERELDISRYRVEQVLAAADVVRRHGAYGARRFRAMIAAPAENDTIVKPSLPSERKAVVPVPRVEYPRIRSVDGTFTCCCGAVSRPGAVESFRALEFRWGKFTREHGGCEHA